MTGFNSKRDAAADKLQEPVCDKDPQGCWNVRCQLGKQCKNLAQPAQEPVDWEQIYWDMVNAMLRDKLRTQPAQEPAEWSWVCNECGAREFLSSVSESDLKFLSCGGCGCDEFHKENTTPPQREPLTDEAVLDIADYYLYNGGKTYGVLEFARAIETAHGIKENT